jgi:hypothetical protein
VVICTLLIGGLLTFILTMAPSNANDMAVQAPQAGEPAPIGIPGAVSGSVGEASSGAGPGEDNAYITDKDEPPCDFKAWVDQPVDEDVVKATGRPYRILKPGAMVTRDFSADRINVEVNEQSIVTAVHCD